MPPTSRRERLRSQQLAQARARRLSRIVAIGAAIVALVLIAVFAVIAWQQGSGGGTVPPNANATSDGIVANPGKARPGAPTVLVYEDFQCPACKSLEDRHGKLFADLADSGQITLEYRTRTFLDALLRNDSSNRAAIAAACADTVGRYRGYHDAIFAGQPAVEGAGFTAEQLRVSFPQVAGIAGEALTAFQACYDTRATAGFVTTTDRAALDAGVTGTPTLRVNGREVSYETAMEADDARLRTLLLGG